MSSSQIVPFESAPGLVPFSSSGETTPTGLVPYGPGEFPPNRGLIPELGVGLRSGFENAKASVGGALEMAGSGLGIEPLRQWGRKIREGSNEEALRYMPRVTRVEDIRSRDDLGDWLAYAIGNIGPSIGAAIGGGAAGFAVAGPPGAIAGAGSISYILNAGEVYADMIEQGVDAPAAAALAGIPMALLDVIVPTKVAGKLVWTATKKQVVGGMAKRLLKEVPKTALLEAGTEATQELIGAGTAASQGAGEFMSPETASRVLNAFSVGFVGGGLFGGMGEIAPQKGPFRPTGAVSDASGVDVPTIPTVEEIAQIAQGPVKAEEPTAPVGDLPGDQEEQVVGKGETKGVVVLPSSTPVVEAKPITEQRREPWQMTRAEFDKEFWFTGRGTTHPYYGKEEMTGAKGFARIEFSQPGQPLPGSGTGEIRLIRGSDVPREILPESTEAQRISSVGFNSGVVSRFSVPGDVVDPHVYLIERALREGQPVPREVLDEYPDLVSFPSTLPLGELPTPLPEAFTKHGTEYVKWLSEQVGRPVEEFMGIDPRYLPDAVKGMTTLEAYPHLPGSARRGMSFKEWAKENDKGEVVGDILPEHALSIGLVNKAMKGSGAFEPPRAGGVVTGDPEIPRQITEEMVHVGMGVKWLHTLIQVVDRNPWAEPAKRFLNVFRDGWQPTKTAITMKGDEEVKAWRGLGTKQEAALSRMRGRAAAEHLVLGRNLTQAELAKIAKEEGVSPAALEMYPQITKFLQSTIGMLEEAKLASLAQTGENTPTEIARIKEDFASYRDNDDYFPAMRFGPHWNVVRAVEAMDYQGRKVKAGGLVWAEAFSTRTERDMKLRKLKKRFAGAAFAVSDTYMPPNTASFQGIPPSAVETLRGKLKLSKEQEQLLRDVVVGLTPGRSFVKQLSRREGVAGESREGTRVLATYTQSIASHIARLKYKGELDQVIKDMGKMAREAQNYGGPSAKMGELQEILQQNLDYNMDPGYDFASIRSGLFWYYFVFMPKQAIVNLAQIPMLAYPYLAATMPRSGGKADAIAVKELAKAMVDLGANAYTRASLPWKKAEEPTLRLSPRDQRHMTRGVQAGFVKESYAADVAGAASGKILHRLLPGKRADAIARRMTEIGIMPFALSEEYNRRVTHLAAGRIGQQMGWTEDQTFEYGRSAVESTMFEYASWNRFKAARGKPAVLFLFKTFLQHATYFTFAHPGKGRFLGMMLMIGGVTGLTGAEDILDLLDGIGTALKRKLGFEGDPRVALREELREFATSISTDPDLFMHGLGRSSFGLHQLGKLFGAPIPAMDFASSIQLGRVIPGVEPISEAIGQGKADWPHLFTRTAQDVAGAGGSMVMNWARATVTDSPDANYWRKVVAPAFVRSYLRYGEYKGGAARDWRGEKLVEFDPENAEHQAEMLGQLLGVMPRRVRQVQDTRWEFYEMIQFYTTRREILLTQYAYAAGNKLQEQKAGVVKDILKHNRNVPPEFSISPSELRQSFLRRTKNRKMREMGQPTQKRYIRLYRNFLELYPAPVE